MSSRRGLAAAFALRVGPVLVGSNLAGAAVLWLYLVFLAPDPTRLDPTGDLVNSVVLAGYLLLAVVLGVAGGAVVLRPLLGWLRGRPALDEERLRRAVLRLPARLVRLCAALWAVGVVLFGALNLGDGAGPALSIALTVALGGLTTCALCYLLTERLARPLVAEAMRGAPGPPPVLLGVRRRLLLAWSLGTGVPVLGIVIGLVDVLGEGRLDDRGVLFLALVALAVGLLSMLFAARSVADPLEHVSRALRDVGEGRLDVRVPVDDASEVGVLQSGVNAMVAGLAEREQLRDLLGRQVGTDVARLALEQGVRLGGERRDVAVLFVDVVGSTGLAERLGPEEVVTRLNAFFAVVVDAVTEHGGWVDSFVGDGALCVFGAPTALPDPRSSALRAARLLAQRLVGLPVEAAIGVGGGPVVAGNVGTESRFEYTVIGDPVNAAARLVDLAKHRPGRVLADAALLEGLGEEARCWEPDGEAVLRGRSAPTRLAVPSGSGAAGQTRPTV